jgi:hypothetical protein
MRPILAITGLTPSPMKMGEGWDGGVLAGIAPIPAFPRCRVKEWVGEFDRKSQ